MIVGYHPVIQALFGTLFTWGLTAAGSGFVFIFSSGKRKVLDGSLGFAAGVMTAASYWSLLAPAIEMAGNSGLYGADGQYAFIPAAIGFIAGAMFVHYADMFVPNLGGDPSVALALGTGNKLDKDGHDAHYDSHAADDSSITIVDTGTQESSARRRIQSNVLENGSISSPPNHTDSSISGLQRVSWRRILLLIIAITIHNIPAVLLTEGLAVGVGFGAVGKSSTATFENARNLAIGIGIQNFPEGLAVSLPLRGSGMSVWKSFWYGQLSGMVEPIAGVLGAVLVTIAEPLLPYALAFAAGAMIFVVVDDIIPEAQVCGNGKLSSIGATIGFVVMMSLDVGLG